MKITVKSAGPKGRGVFACQKIPRDLPIEKCPATRLTAEQRRALHGMDGIGEYPFVDRQEYAKRDERQKRLPCPGFVAWGLMSIVNHSDYPNVRVELYDTPDGPEAIMTAVRDIEPMDELLLAYPDKEEYENSDEWSNMPAGMVA